MKQLCCGGTVPLSLSVTLTASGPCACASGSFTIVWGANPFGTGPGWSYSGTRCNGNNFFILLTCFGDIWSLTLSCGPGGFGTVFNANPTNTADPGGSCNPFNQTWTGTHAIPAFGNVCCTGVGSGSGDISAVITA